MTTVLLTDFKTPSEFRGNGRENATDAHFEESVARPGGPQRAILRQVKAGSRVALLRGKF